MKPTAFSKFAVAALGYNLLVIAFGAYVRHTGSGAGCGSHWPLCNGEVIPRAPSVETIIEYTHRITSGIALLLIVGLLWWSFKAFAKGHPARKAAFLALVFTIISALIGAGLVKFELVADNASMARAITLSLHLINTMLLLGALTLAAMFGAGLRGWRLRGQGGTGLAFALGAVGILFVGMSGAVTSLGDTLFPASSSAEVIWASLSTTGHFLVRLRLWHPVIAVGVAALLILIAAIVSDARPDRRMKQWLAGVVGIVVLQLLLGLVAVWLKAPTWMALLHLLLADALWITFVAAAAFGLSSRSEAAGQAAPMTASPAFAGAIAEGDQLSR